MNTKEARLKTWILGHFEIQDNSPVSEGFLSPAKAYSRKSAGSLPAVCREPGSPRVAFQASPPYGADLLGADNPRLQSIGHYGGRHNGLVLDRLARRLRRPDLAHVATSTREL